MGMAKMKHILLDFIYKYSLVFNFGLNRKKFECIATGDKLFAVNNSRNTIIALLFTFCACAFLFTGIAQTFNRQHEISIEFIIVFFVIHPVIGLMGLKQFLWLINGRQEMTIENGKLILEKKGTFWTKPKIYSVDRVTNIREGIDEQTLSLKDKIRYNSRLNRKVIFGHVTGQVLFNYQYDEIKVFSDLDKNEKTFLIDEIKKNILPTAYNS
jgi:uncharacterized membrane protein YhaH (DUF805 family)